MHAMNPLIARNDQVGFTLIESLVALMIFAFGILGLIGMQAVAARATADSQYRVEAAGFAERLVNQMRTDNRLTLATEYSSSGTKWSAWLSDVQNATTGLPGATTNPPTVTFADSAVGVTPASTTVTLTIYWKGPSEVKEHKYVTVATLY